MVISFHHKIVVYCTSVHSRNCNLFTNALFLNNASTTTIRNLKWGWIKHDITCKPCSSIMIREEVQCGRKLNSFSSFSHIHKLFHVSMTPTFISMKI